MSSVLHPTTTKIKGNTLMNESRLKELADRARYASEASYSPYSKFRVGAAALSTSGVIWTGCNVENASYGLTICAERNAVFQLAAARCRHIEAVAIYTPTEVPTAPCGACRQVINEFGPEALVISTCDGPGVIQMPLSALLPAAFGPANLG